MKPISRRSKISQEMLLDIDRQAKDLVLEMHLQEALNRAIKPTREQHQPRQTYARAAGYETSLCR